MHKKKLSFIRAVDVFFLYLQVESSGNRHILPKSFQTDEEREREREMFHSHKIYKYNSTK